MNLGEFGATPESFRQRLLGNKRVNFHDGSVVLQSLKAAKGIFDFLKLQFYSRFLARTEA